jgi:hypothetical protein
MKKIIIALAFVMILWPLSSFAQGVCFDDETAGRMVVALEQAKFSEEQLGALNTASVELIQQKEILQGTIQLLYDQINTYKSMQEMSTKMGEMQDKACKEQIKAATPTFMQRLQQNFLAGGIGAAIAAVVILLL